ncbi:MAG: hypothetical protein ACYDD1_12685 [Caulobacteraceae bacterium]
MQVPSSMLLVATLVIAAGAAVISPVQAAETPQLSDVAYLQAAHCAGLAEGAKLDTKHVDTVLQTEEANRFGWIYDKAQDLRQTGAREARQATGVAQVQVKNDLNACAAYLGVSPTTSVANAR